jgi:hypothetical protein
MMPDISMRGNELLKEASNNLSRFVMSQAKAFEVLLGFAWKPEKDAPSKFSTLKAAYLSSLITGNPLPVSDEHSAMTIYDSPTTNYAFRFWHDVTHIRLDQGFDLDGEMTVARSHLAVLTAAGWGEGTLEYELLRADTLGQTLCNETTGGFPLDQPCFARRAITTTIGRAIRLEAALRSGNQGSNSS